MGRERSIAALIQRLLERAVILYVGRHIGAIALSKRDNSLHGALAERTGTNERRTFLVLERAGDDFRCRCRTAVNQYDHRLAVGKIAGSGVEALHLTNVAATSRNNFPPF